MNPPSLGSYRPSNPVPEGYSQPIETTKQDTIFWSKSEFTIPFHVDATGKQPAEVQLEISSDGGAHWSLHARDSLQARQFRFASTQDGLYLFRIKTIDEYGQSFDTGGPPLRVLVDTQSPELSLTIDTDPQGRMFADIALIDSNPNVDSMRLEYQTEQNNRWTAIALEPIRVSNEEVRGRGTWEVPLAARQLVVRFVARDAAGNEAEVTRLPLLPKTAFGSSGLQLASGIPSPRFGQSSSSAQTAPNANAAAAGLQAARPSLASAPPYSPIPTATSTGAPAAASFGSPFANPSTTKVQSTPSYPPASASVASTVSRYALQTLPSDSLNRDSEKNSAEAMYLEDSNAASVQTDRPSTSDPSSPPIDTDRVEPPLGTAQSITEKPYFSHSRAFSLDYELDAQAASPVASIELWGTTDKGLTWERWGTDPDGVSPFEIKVEAEGLFGFRMVVVGANGLVGNRPNHGDNADAWVHVDTEQPTARIVSALYGKGVETSSLVVEYTAQDAYFGERPITLSYSELPTGPWTTIANGLRNTGRFVWPADPSLPRRVYLKLDAHDEAGNVGQHRLDVPVDIEGLAPRGRIQGFRPISDS